MEQAPGLLYLRQGPLALQWLPALGACCAGLRHHGGDGRPASDILRPLPSGAADPFLSGFFALVPYSNRLFGQMLLAPGQAPRKIALNRPGQLHPIHGVGWMQEWELRQATASSLQLAYTRAADTYWPFAHGATMDIRLSASTLSIALELQNLSALPMPAGTGFHPWLTAEPDAELRFDAQSMWRKDAAGLPQDRIDPAEDARFACAGWRLVHGLDLDHCYALWQGQVELRRPSAGLTVRLRASADQGHLQVYRPPGQAWVCVEPVSHAAGAFSLQGCHAPQHGMRLLAPGATLHSAMELSVSGL